MKTQFNDTVKFVSNYKTQIAEEFTTICNMIAMSTDQDELKALLKEVDFTFFLYGFGSSHMWVKQYGHLSENNLLTVYF